MQRGWIRRPIEFLALGISLAVTAAALYVIFRPPTAPADGTVSDSHVPVNGGSVKDAERNLLIMVRQAVLSEGPVGQQAQQRASHAKVKAVGARISADYLALGDQTLNLAIQMHVIVPSTPSAEQRRWMAELSAQIGGAYERDLVRRLRDDESKILALATHVRAETKNGLMRDFAQRTQLAAETHMSLLKGTGLV